MSIEQFLSHVSEWLFIGQRFCLENVKIPIVQLSLRNENGQDENSVSAHNIHTYAHIPPPPPHTCQKGTQYVTSIPRYMPQLFLVIVLLTGQESNNKGSVASIKRDKKVKESFRLYSFSLPRSNTNYLSFMRLSECVYSKVYEKNLPSRV